MQIENESLQVWEEARKTLGVCSDAGTEQVRQAYLAQVRQHPPDRDPEAFERIRDAYDRLRDPKLRAQQVLAGPDPERLLTGLLDGDVPRTHRYVGPAPWLAVLKEGRS